MASVSVSSVSQKCSETLKIPFRVSLPFRGETETMMAAEMEKPEMVAP